MGLFDYGRISVRKTSVRTESYDKTFFFPPAMVFNMGHVIDGTFNSCYKYYVRKLPLNSKRGIIPSFGRY